MTHEQKIEYMRISAGIVGFAFKEEGLDMLVSVYDLVLEKEGEGTMKDVCAIEYNVKMRHIEKARVKAEKE